MKSKSVGSKNKRLFLSVIIPAYQAEKFVERNLQDITQVLDRLKYPYEIIFIDDGSKDNTYKEAKKVAKKIKRKIKVFRYKNNLGKGHAVRYGMAKSNGDIIAFMDAGLDLNPKGLSMLLEHFEWYNSDIIVGSKWHTASKVQYSWQRKILSIGYRYLVALLFGLKVRDTQVGMKFFKREVLERTLPRLLVKKFAFDIEMLAVAYHLGYKNIHEAPIESKKSLSGSTIVTQGFVRTVFWMLWDTLAVFYRLKILGYYNEKNRKNWITPDYLTLNNKKK